MKKTVSLIITILILGGCFPYQSTYYTDAYKGVHIYEVTVIDIDGNPLEGVKVYSELYANYEFASSDIIYIFLLLYALGIPGYKVNYVYLPGVHA